MATVEATMQAWEAKKAARKVIADQLAATHRYLVPVSDKCNSLVAAAKNIRIELAREFRGCKFAVRSSRFSGGDSIDVSWTDGPTTRQVDSIIDKYSAGYFDGMTDSYSYNDDHAWTDAFGDAKYVHSHRSYSDRWVMAVMYRVAKRLGGLDRIPTLEDYRQGRLYQVRQSGGCDYAREVTIALSETTGYPTAIAIDGDA